MLNQNNDDDKEIKEIVADIQEAILELDRIEQLKIDTIERIKSTTLVKALNLAKRYSQQHDEVKRLLSVNIYKDIKKFLETKYDN